MDRMSIAAFAAAHGVSKQAAAKWKARGAIVLDGPLVDVEQSDAKMKEAGFGRFRAERAPASASRRTARSGVTAEALAAALAPNIVAQGMAMRAFVADMAKAVTLRLGIPDRADELRALMEAEAEGLIAAETASIAAQIKAIAAT